MTTKQSIDFKKIPVIPGLKVNAEFGIKGEGKIEEVELNIIPDITEGAIAAEHVLRFEKDVADEINKIIFKKAENWSRDRIQEYKNGLDEDIKNFEIHRIIIDTILKKAIRTHKNTSQILEDMLKKGVM